MTTFLAAMKDVAQRLHLQAPHKRDAAVNDMRNAVAQNFAGGVLPAEASLAIFTAVSAQAIADMLIQIPPHLVKDAEIVQVFAEELSKAKARNQPMGLLNGVGV